MTMSDPGRGQKATRTGITSTRRTEGMEEDLDGGRGARRWIGRVLRCCFGWWAWIRGGALPRWLRGSWLADGGLPKQAAIDGRMKGRNPST